MKFHTKSVEVEAVLWDGSVEAEQAIRRLADPGAHIYFNYNGEIDLFWLGSMVIAQKGDWIVRGVKGEVYPYKPDVFRLTHEFV